jgi:hypothetical protein
MYVEGPYSTTLWAALRKSAVSYKTVEIDDSKSGRRKYNKGHKMNRQWVFSGVERESGKQS